MNKTYIEFVYEYIKKQEIDKPIYVAEVSKQMQKAYDMSFQKALAATSVAFKRIIDNKMIPELRFYQKGIYYRTIATVFGESNIDKEQLIEDKYLKDDSGYETGLLLLHKMGLTTQIPNERVIATNKINDCTRIDKKLGVIVRPGKIEINADNKQYLKILDVLDILDKAPIDVMNPYGVVGAYIKQLNLEYYKLLALADNYYNKNTVLQLAHVAGEQI